MVSRHTFRPTLDTLEDRRVPAVVSTVYTLARTMPMIERVDLPTCEPTVQAALPKMPIQRERVDSLPFEVVELSPIRVQAPARPTVMTEMALSPIRVQAPAQLNFMTEKVLPASELIPLTPSVRRA